MFSTPRPFSVVTLTCALVLLYFGRPVLEPLVLALILSLVVSPLIRTIGRLGLGYLASTALSLCLIGACLAAVGATLAVQLVSVTKELPRYRTAIELKLEKIQDLTEGPFTRLASELNIVAPAIHPAHVQARAPGLAPDAERAIPVEIRTPAPNMRDTLARAISVVSGPIGEAGLVFVLLIFILLEQESLRERVVRLMGQSEVSRTIRALVHAGQGVSHFFFSQCVVNILFAAAVATGLRLLDVPHALLWGALSGLLRFIPYVGALVAGGAIALFVAATDPGWTLAFSCMGLFAALEVVVGNFVEPKVYGHTSGLSPFAVVVSALFWGAMWGPAGLFISTPLTLCLVVAGRHVRGLESIAILFADTPSISEAERFYHRILAGGSTTVIQHAHTYLRRNSFARYCDCILVPGLDMAVADRNLGLIDRAQEDRIRATVIALADTLMQGAAGNNSRTWRRRKISVVEANIGAHLRQAREARLGLYQGSLDVPSRSIVLCAGMSDERDQFLNELLVLALREVGVDARSVVLDEPQRRPNPEEAKTDELVSAVFMAYPAEGAIEAWKAAVAEFRAHVPGALLVTIRRRDRVAMAHQRAVEALVDIVLHSFEEGVAFVAPAKTRVVKV